MQPTHYEITVRGRLGAALIGAFDDLTATPTAANTVIRGEIVDQAALYGVLERIESLGLELPVPADEVGWVLDVRRTASAR